MATVHVRQETAPRFKDTVEERRKHIRLDVVLQDVVVGARNGVPDYGPSFAATVSKRSNQRAEQCHE